jgi:hypothetical protein
MDGSGEGLRIRTRGDRRRCRPGEEEIAEEYEDRQHCRDDGEAATHVVKLGGEERRVCGHSNTLLLAWQRSWRVAPQSLNCACCSCVVPRRRADISGRTKDTGTTYFWKGIGRV